MKTKCKSSIGAYAVSIGMTVISVWLITACSSTRHNPQQQDSVYPAGIDPQYASVVGCLGNPELGIGESCWLAVQSELLSNFAGIIVQSKHRYRVHVPPGQFLFDNIRRVPMPEGDAGSNFTRYFGFIKRKTDEPWFALMATLGVTADTNALRISRTTELPEACGRIDFWINDYRYKYGNNQGRLWIRLERMPDVQAAVCPASP